MEWLENLNSAIEYIENNLDKTISIEEVAHIACCSTHYFKRMFSYIAGISLSEYIRRRRMTQAAFELQSTDKRVLDIALKYGYNSPTAFNRAFQNIHGISPIAVRKNRNVLNAYLPIRFSVQIMGDSAMQYHIEQKEEMRVVGIRISISENMEYNRKIVPTFWEKLLHGEQISVLSNLSNQLPYGLLGITIYQKPNMIYYYIAVSTDKAVPENMFEYYIPASTWAVFKNNGAFKESVQNIFKRFSTEWLPFSGYSYAELPDIEVYPFEDYSKDDYSEVWIAIKK